MSLAPISIGTYSRINHLKQTVESLQKNTLAKQSELYIFSDAAKKGDEEMVQIVRDYIHSIDGFKKVYIIEREINDIIANNRGGVEKLLNEYGKVIYMEDDNITAPGFLQFMNDALDTYEDRLDIVGICAYTPPLPSALALDMDSYIVQSYIAWGTALWKDKYCGMKPIFKKDYLELVESEKNINYVKNNCGGEYLERFQSEYLYNNNYGDTRATFSHYLNNTYTLYPKKSLVLNIGHDGSGQQCGVIDKFNNVDLWSKIDNFYLNKDIKINHKVKKEYINFFTYSNLNVDADLITIKNIMKQIDDLNVKSLSIYGTTIYCDVIFEELEKRNIIVNYFVNTTVSDHSYYKNKKIISLQSALKNGETNFVLATYGSRFIMHNNIKKITSKDLNIIMYEKD